MKLAIVGYMNIFLTHRDFAKPETNVSMTTFTLNSLTADYFKNDQCLLLLTIRST